jgi:hypothetical protein
MAMARCPTKLKKVSQYEQGTQHISHYTRQLFAADEIQ